MEDTRWVMNVSGKGTVGVTFQMKEEKIYGKENRNLKGKEKKGWIDSWMDRQTDRQSMVVFFFTLSYMVINDDS